MAFRTLPDGTDAQVVVALNPDGTTISGGGGGGGGGATTIANGADVATGSTTDAAVTADAAGTLSAKLRGLVKIFASVWDSANGRLNVATADGANSAQGAKADVRATWYDSPASLISLTKLWIAAAVGAGSRTYTYTSGQLTSEAWTLFGTTRTKTYTYTGGVLTGESDWV